MTVKLIDKRPGRSIPKTEPNRAFALGSVSPPSASSIDRSKSPRMPQNTQMFCECVWLASRGSEACRGTEKPWRLSGPVCPVVPPIL